MKLQQLKYLSEVRKNGLNVSATAEHLYTSQPGISKQIRLLEDELGVQVFNRSGKHLTGVTPPGEQILEIAERILRDAENIRTIAKEYASPDKGLLRIATTHTQARYALPEIIKPFKEKYPGVGLQMHQGSPKQIAQFAVNGEVDFAIATEQMHRFNNLVMLPCYKWNRSIVVPKGHPLLEIGEITMESLAHFPLITYVFGFTGRSKLDKAFARKKLEPQVVFAATDADVIKTYVRLGLGVGIIASMAFDENMDSDLVAIDASHLFEPNATNLGFHRNTFFREYMFQFIELFAPHLSRELILEAQNCRDEDAVNKLFSDIELPIH